MQLRISLTIFAAKGKMLTFVQLDVHWAQAPGQLFSSQSASIMLWYKGLHFLKYQTLEFQYLNLHKAVVGPFGPPAEQQQNLLVYESLLSFVLPGNLLRAQSSNMLIITEDGKQDWNLYWA